ncbi:MAG: NAD(P)H-hydrate dehydratase [Pseudobdellovibrionaceae bacterium]
MSGGNLRENSSDLFASLLVGKSGAAHKYAYGCGLIVTGTMTGASILAGKAALRCGIGLLVMACDARNQPIYQATLTEALSLRGRLKADFQSILDQKKPDHILIGQGFGRENDVALKTQVLELAHWTKQNKCTLILDADAISVFEDDQDIFLKALHKRCVLTPHEGEFSRVFGEVGGDRVASLHRALEVIEATIILKGENTLIGAAGRPTLINYKASPWLATGGTGDVLAGTILGLAGLAGHETHPQIAAGAAVWLHGSASLLKGPGLIATDLPELYPEILREFAGEAF